MSEPTAPATTPRHTASITLLILGLAFDLIWLVLNLPMMTAIMTGTANFLTLTDLIGSLIIVLLPLVLLIGFGIPAIVRVKRNQRSWPFALVTVLAPALVIVGELIVVIIGFSVM